MKKQFCPNFAQKRRGAPPLNPPLNGVTLHDVALFEKGIQC